MNETNSNNVIPLTGPYDIVAVATCAISMCLHLTYRAARQTISCEVSIEEMRLINI
jgi:hypothetical protein